MLEIDRNPIIVDTGCSTYERGEIRNFERSTKAHNTVVVNNTNSSQVWASHRVGKKAKVTILEDNLEKIVAFHDGYKNFRKKHYRTFYKKENSLTIVDEIKGNKNNTSNIAYFHLDNSIDNVKIEENMVNLDKIQFLFEGASSIQIEEYEQAISFNNRKTAKCICISFASHLSTFLIIS